MTDGLGTAGRINERAASSLVVITKVYRRVRRSLRRVHVSESGKTLPAALWVLAIGAILMGPFLSHVSTSLIAGLDLQDDQRAQYAADAGVEFGIWKLLHDSSYRTSVDASPGSPVALPPIAVNQFVTNTSAESISSGGWSVMANAPDRVRSGGALCYTGGDYIYALRGDYSREFWRYSISGDSWEDLTSITSSRTVGAGGSLVYTGGDYIYALIGNNQSLFYRYRISTDTWQRMWSAPARIGAGGALTYTGGDYIYALQGNNRSGFFSYRISSNRWNNRWSTLSRVREGGALAYSGGDNIYAFQGRNTTSFWRYDISDNRWYDDVNDTPERVRNGGSMAYDQSAFIYALRGANTTDFWRYDISAGGWSLQPSVPATINDGAALVYTGGGVFYALRGNNQPHFGRYEAGGSQYEIVAQADDFTITSVIDIAGMNVTVLSWDIN